MDSVCHSIYSYVIAKQKVCLFAVVRDLGINIKVAEKYLSDLIKMKLIKFDFVFNTNKRRDAVRKIYKSPLNK